MTHYNNELRHLYNNGDQGPVAGAQDPQALIAALTTKINSLEEEIAGNRSNVNQLWANQLDIAALAQPHDANTGSAGCVKKIVAAIACEPPPTGTTSAGGTSNGV